MSVQAVDVDMRLTPGAEEAISRIDSFGQRPVTFRLDNGDFPVDSVMAIDPSAFDRTYAAAFRTDVEARRKPYSITAEGVAVLDVMGPLARRAFESWFWFMDGYDFIEQRFAAALKDPDVEALVMRLDSPGGVASGMVETASAMRRAKVASGKRVYAYADDLAASAAYGLASAADEIWLPESGMVGSVGVIGVLSEQSSLLKKIGINVRVITTGEHKADGHPAVPLTEEVVKRYQARIDHLGDLFFSLVADGRNMSTKDVKALEAGIFQGSAAVRAGLADGISGFEDLVTKAVRSIKSGATSGASGRERVHMATEATAATRGSAGTGDSSPPDHKVFALACALAASASESEVLSAISDLRGMRNALTNLTGKTDSSEALGVVQAGLIAAKAVPDLQKQLTELKAADTQRDVDACIESGKTAGKITNTETETQLRVLGATNPAQLKALLAALPVLVTTQTSATREAATNGSVTLSTEEREVARQLGVTPEAYVEARKAHEAEATNAQKGS